MSGEDARSLRGILTLVETSGSVVLPSRTVETLASVDVRAALHAARVLVSAPPAPTWPCTESGCAREIRGNYDGARKPLVAVCAQVPAVCPAVELSFDDVAQQQIVASSLVRRACELLSATVDPSGLSAVDERGPIGEARIPVRVATSESPPRDVFFARSPRDTDLGAFCLRRDRLPRETLVLVPTGDRIPLDLAARYASGENVEILALADAIEVKEGAIVRRGALERPAVDRAEATSLEAASPVGIAALLGTSNWADIRFGVVDPHTVRIEAGGKSILRTFVELGFVDGRKTDVVRFVSAWPLFILFVKNRLVRPSEYADFGKPYAVKKAVEYIGKALRAAFGIAQHPILPYSRDGGYWEPRFRVVGPKVEEEEGKRRKKKK